MAKRTKKRKPVKGKKIQKPDFSFKRSELLPALGVVAITAILFARACGYDFVNWDDDYNISKNPNLRYFDWASIKGIFTSHVIGNYNPFPILTFAIEKHFFGLDPKVFHTTNVILHAVCVFLVYRLTRLMDFPVWAAAAAALVFGIHPLRIESVAWITERKDVLFASFYFGAMIQYVKHLKSGGKMKYLVFAILLFICSLFSKIQAVALPLSLMAVIYLMYNDIKPKKDVKKWLYRRGAGIGVMLALSLTFGLIGIYFLGQQGSLNTTAVYAFTDRIFVGMYSYMVYLVKFFVPYRISPLYPYPPVLHWTAYASVIPFLAVIGVTALGYFKNWRQLVFALGFFTLNIMFVLQVVGAGQGYLADRFTYVPYFGLIFGLVYYATKLSEKSKRHRTGVFAGLGVWCAALFVWSWMHVSLWENSGTLWTHVLKYYDKAALPYRNRAQFYRDNGQLEAALQDYSRSIQLKQNPDVVNSRARLYFDNQMWEPALKDYDLAIQLEGPTQKAAEYYINRGAVHAMTSNWQPALNDMTEGIRLDPSFANGYKNRSLVYQAINQPREALADLEQYLVLNPYDSDIHYEAGRLYRQLRSNNEALNSLNTAIRLNSGKGIYWLERARVNITLGNKAAAQRDLQQAQALGTQIDEATRKAIMQ